MNINKESNGGIDIIVMVIDKNVLLIIVWLLYVIYMAARIYKNIKEARAIKTRKQVIDKAIQYWDARLRELKQEIREGYDITRPKELIDFKKAMEE